MIFSACEDESENDDENVEDGSDVADERPEPTVDERIPTEPSRVACLRIADVVEDG